MELKSVISKKPVHVHSVKSKLDVQRPATWFLSNPGKKPSIIRIKYKGTDIEIRQTIVKGITDGNSKGALRKTSLSGRRARSKHI